MAYIIPGIPPRPVPDAPGLLTPRGVAASLARATTRRQREQAEDRAFAALATAAQAADDRCRTTHPVPAPYPAAFGPGIITPDRCHCYLTGPESTAMMAWRSNFCSHCGGEGLCVPGCEAMDARH